ncbi:hypothetical protein [Bradyrhizobium sp. LHD-71]|uniref:hypothetical protein n=1 Tax=Bradyrhizobium sp. LHD-71 TaxID=3072141 RepID=UPI00280CEF88|nr:hypothetical protein [Bradyrhizobium sp. LHD-71]MDQ8728340.1 hypothetical protein [Bradyrhizobium sp. LHD-71]
MRRDEHTCSSCRTTGTIPSSTIGKIEIWRPYHVLFVRDCRLTTICPAQHDNDGSGIATAAARGVRQKIAVAFRICIREITFYALRLVCAGLFEMFAIVAHVLPASSFALLAPIRALMTGRERSGELVRSHSISPVMWMI